MASYDWSEMETPMANSAPITIALPEGGAFLLQSALMTMDQRWQWKDGTDEIADNDWDDIQALLADVMLAIMTEEDNPMGVPIGFVVPFAATTNPDNWLLCDGYQYLRTAWPLLYATLAPAFIVDDDNFTTPDLTAGFVRGIGTDILTPVGEVGGDSEVALTVAQLAIHYHLIALHDAGGPPANTINEGASGTPSGLVQSLETGGGEAHNNIPTYVALPYYIKAANE